MTPASSRAVLATAAMLSALACAARAHAPAAARTTAEHASSSATLESVKHCEYQVSVRSSEPLRLDVAATCSGRGVLGLEADDARVADAVGSVETDHGVITRRNAAFVLAERAPHVRFAYRVDLDALARLGKNLDLAVRSGHSLIAPASSFLLYPLPLDVGIEVTLRVDAPASVAFASGMQREGDHYRIFAHEIPVATFAAFGRLKQARVELDAGKSTLDLALLDGDVALDFDAITRWAKRRAEIVADFYRGFPAPHALLSLVPIPRARDVVFGKLLPESAPGIVLLLGARSDERALEEDWVLVHELFHIGVPSFDREGKWFDEGLATYFEPLLRVRAGLLDERRAWQDFSSEMPKGLPALTRDGLEHARDSAGVYWGGAIYCLLADVAARRASGGHVGLEDGVRRVHRAGGNASDVWSLDTTLGIADAAFSEPLLRPLAARYAYQPAALDLGGLFRDLGVEAQGREVRLSEQAPLAWLRHAIMHGAPTASSAAASAN